METKKFNMIDEEFICFNCKNHVKPLGYTARDHCPKCLYSLHLDINPGDRKSTCHGILKPIGIEKTKKDNFKIIYECQKCHKRIKNIAAKDDNIEEIIKLSVGDISLI